MLLNRLVVVCSVVLMTLGMTGRPALAATPLPPAPPAVGGAALDTDMGTALAPTTAQTDALAQLQRDTQLSSGAPRRRAASATIPVGSTLGTFELGPDQPQPVPHEDLPYTRVGPVALDGNQPRDSTGVPVYVISGKSFDHPVRQAADGIDMLESYRLTKNTSYLQRATADAQRLIDRRVVTRGGWFYPYPFAFALHGNPNDVIGAPWYSAMAQGMALTLFVHLFQQTQDPKWRQAADQTFVTLTLGPDAAHDPFVTWVDSQRHLFLEEYAQEPLAKSDRTLNGDIFAVYGVYEYALLSGDADADTVFSGALDTVRAYLPSAYRQPGFISHYCLTHGTLSDKYHTIHVAQMATLQGLTGDEQWARWSDQLYNDFPSYHIGSTIWMLPGRQVGYRFDASGAVTARRALSWSPVTRVPVDERIRVRGHGVYYRASGGPWAGYLIAEAPGRAYLHAMMQVRAFPLARTAALPAGDVVVRTYDNGGYILSSKVVHDTAITAIRWREESVIDGEQQLRVSSGPGTGYWVRAADTVPAP